MSAFHLTSISPPAPITQPVRAIQAIAPQPPKAQSDHKPVNTATSSRGPAVVLSGALAKAPDKAGQQAPSAAPPTGQHINRLI